MTANVGNVDRVIRLVIALALIGIGYFGHLDRNWTITVYVLAAIAAITAVVRFCPLWKVLGIDTCHLKSGGV